MARKKISEFRAKKILSVFLDLPYNGLSFDASKDNFSALEELDSSKRYVVKVDEGVKKRMKKGLVALDKSPQELKDEIKKLQEKGYRHFIIEPFVPHASSSEKYLSIERVREGLQVFYSEKGGIEVEDNADSISKIVIPYSSEYSENSVDQVFRQSEDLKVRFSDLLSISNFLKLVDAFNKYHFSFLEINPLVIEDSKFYLLDIAAEVDSAGEFFVHEKWTPDDFRTGQISERTEEEKNVDSLSHQSQASFNLAVLNSDGAVFMLLSGGGASIVLADEVYNLGFGKRIANYGEYSGNPNAEEVYVYTKNLLSLLLKANAPKKVLLIGGGVANFTDVRITFKGIVKALDEKKVDLQKQNVKVFVRRGGPNQKEGLAMMEKFLKENNLYGMVADQRTTLPEIVKAATAVL